MGRLLQRLAVDWSGPLEPLLRHWSLIVALTRREVAARYRGSTLGLVWALASPLLTLVVYTFVFGSIFEARWDVEAGSRGDFASLLFAGLIVYWLISEPLNRAPALMFENPQYVKRVVFPLDALAWVAVGGALFRAGVAIGILVAVRWLWIEPPPWTVLLLPLAVLPVALAALGATWWISSMGVFFRDLREVVPVLTLLLLFLSPVLYPMQAIPEWIQPLLQLNPLAVSIRDFRSLLFPDQPIGIAWGSFAMQTAIGWSIAWIGLQWFRRTASEFADVI